MKVISLNPADLDQFENLCEVIKKSLHGRQIANVKLLIIETIKAWSNLKNYFIKIGWIDAQENQSIAKDTQLIVNFCNEFESGENFYTYLNWITHEFYVKSPTHFFGGGLNYYIVIKLWLVVTFFLEMIICFSTNSYLKLNF